MSFQASARSSGLSQSLSTGSPFSPIGSHVQAQPDAATTITVPAGADGVIISTGAAGVRIRFDGVDPTAAIGLLYLTPNEPIRIDLSPTVASFRVINVTATQKLDYQFVTAF